MAKKEFHRGFSIEKGCIKFYAFDEVGKHAIVDLVKKHGADWDIKLIDSDIVMAACFYYNTENTKQQEKRMMIEELIKTFRSDLELL